VETSLPPMQLLDACLAIEREAGRIRNRAKGPRPLDLDILLYGAQQIRGPGLTLPHPRLAERRFVLEPLAEIAPDLRVPGRDVTIMQLLNACKDSGEVRLHAPPLF